MENQNFKKVRNFQNLYEQHKTNKAREILERQRLGHKKVWLFDKLPHLELPQPMKMDFNGRNIGAIQKEISQQPTLKRIQRGQEGQIGIQSQEENAASFNQVDQQAILASVKPVLKKNLYHNDNNVILTFKSFEIYLIDDELQKPRLLNPLYVPVSQLKDLLGLSKKKLELKIMEAISYDKSLGQFSYNGSQKSLSPSPKRKAMTVKNKFENKLPNPMKQDLSNKAELPEFIYSSVYIEHLNKDFRVSVKAPTIEYTIPSKPFSFIKILQLGDIKEFLDCSFKGWETILIRNFTSHSKFLEITQSLSKSHAIKIFGQPSLNQPRFNGRASLQQPLPLEEKLSSASSKTSLYVFSKDSKLFDSIDQFQDERILLQSMKLRGCFDKQGIIGNIQLKSFQLKIKGLENSFDYKESIDFENWQKYLKFMRKAAKKDHENPEQLLDLISELFLESLQKGTQFCLEKAKQLEKYKTGKNKKQSDKLLKRSLSLTKITSNYFKLQKRSKIVNSQSSQKDGVSGRYLLELEYPVAKVSLDEESIVRSLGEGDCEYLVEQKFSNWKQYLMNQLYRLELNVSSNEPLPRIHEVRKEDEGEVFSEGDFREKYPPKDENEKKTIVETRTKLSQWFPI